MMEDRIKHTVSSKMALTALYTLNTMLTITIGMASNMEEQSIDEWINIADTKLYSGKHSGKNRLVA